MVALMIVLISLGVIVSVVVTVIIFSASSSKVVRAIAPKVMMARNAARCIWIISFPIVVLRGATAIAIIVVVIAIVVVVVAAIALKALAAAVPIVVVIVIAIALRLKFVSSFAEWYFIVTLVICGSILFEHFLIFLSFSTQLL